MERTDAELTDINREHALIAHEVHRSFIVNGNEATIASGQAAVRNLFLMHGGALVAMLAFTSGLISSNSMLYRWTA